MDKIEGRAARGCLYFCTSATRHASKWGLALFKYHEHGWRKRSRSWMKQVYLWIQIVTKKSQKWENSADIQKSELLEPTWTKCTDQGDQTRLVRRVWSVELRRRRRLTSTPLTSVLGAGVAGAGRWGDPFTCCGCCCCSCPCDCSFSFRRSTSHSCCRSGGWKWTK